MNTRRQVAFFLMIGYVAGCNDGASSGNTATGGTTSATGGVTNTAGGATNTAGGATNTAGGATNTAGGATNTAGGQTTATATGGTVAMTTGPTVTTTVTVSGASPKPVAKTFFGQNYWSWVPAWGDAVAGVEAQTKTLGLNILRAGGANNDKQSPSPFSLTEIDDFVSFAKNVGAEPLLQVPVIKNIAGATPTAQDAADLVTYVNVTKSYGVKYFSIGNEPELYVEQSLQTAGYDAVAFCTTFKEFATAMRAVDPSIKIVGPDLSWKYQSGTNDWLTPFLQNCGDVTDIVAVHRYPMAPTACTESAAYGDVATYRTLLSHLRDIMTKTAQGDKPLAITEANFTYDGDPAKSTMVASPGTFPAALWVADNLGASLEAQLHSVSYWSLSEGWTLGFFSGTAPRPAYYMLKLFSTGFGSEVLTVTGAPTGVSIYAGRDATAGKTSVFVVNKTTSPLKLTVDLAEVPRTASAALSVSPISLQVAVLPDDGSAPTITVYSADMAAPTQL
jgi:hypothetical protein